MKAVNLIPSEGRSRGFSTDVSFSPVHAVLALLAVAVAFATIYVLTGNTISKRRAEIATVRAQTAQERVRAGQLTNYVSFDQLAQARAQTVRQIATTRFDWHGALTDLSKVVPANTSLQSLFGSVAPQVTTSGNSGGSGVSSQLRNDIAAPAFELTGCSKTQDDVARLISRLRLINGVTRVTLGDSVKASGAQGGASVSSGTGPGTGGQAAGCGANAPTFDLVVFFKPLHGADPTTGVPATAPAPGSPAAGTPAAGTPAAATTTTGAPAPTTTTPVSTSGTGG